MTNGLALLHRITHDKHTHTQTCTHTVRHMIHTFILQQMQKRLNDLLSLCWIARNHTLQALKLYGDVW